MQINAERRNKVNLIRQDLLRFFSSNDLPIDLDIIDFSEMREKFNEFLLCYKSQSGNAAVIDIESSQTIGNDYPDYDLIMGFVHAGGNLSSLECDGKLLNITGLAKQVINSSPQLFILRSGLLPGKKTIDMYVSLVTHLLTGHKKNVIKAIASSETYADIARYQVSVQSLASIAGIADTAQFFSRTALSKKTVERLSGQSPRNLRLDYLAELMSTAAKVGPEAAQFLGSIFMTDAFDKAIKTESTKSLVKTLKTRAQAWADHLFCHMNAREDFVEQLLACALITTPKHFHAAGFDKNNMMGLAGSSCIKGLHRTICDGPIGLLINKSYEEDQVRTALLYTQELLPEFTVTEMLETKGFRHVHSVYLLQAIGGYSPAAENAILDERFETDKRFPLISMIYNMDVFGKYSAKSLDKLMSFYILRIPLRRADGTLEEAVMLELTSDMKALAKKEFTRAFEVNDKFKTLFKKRLENTAGLTSEHILVFGLDPLEIPKIIGRMHATDKGIFLEDKLGL